jgi:hypothetical protein
MPRGKWKVEKSKKVTQYFTKQMKAPTCPKMNKGNKSKLMFYSDTFGRVIPTSLSKINVDVSVFGEVMPSIRTRPWGLLNL